MTPSPLKDTNARQFILRVAAPVFDELNSLVFSRYPRREWATFARFGWRQTKNDLVITLVDIDAPNEGDLDESENHVVFHEPYTLRMALAAENHVLAVGVIHSHPEHALPQPSRTDDDMDKYYAKYFLDFAPNRPYVSLIFSKVGKRLLISGRVFWDNHWFTLKHVAAERFLVETWTGVGLTKSQNVKVERAERFVNAFGEESLSRLRAASVAVVGAGGTGSAAIETLARAGVGRLIVVDPDIVEHSNLERVHGSFPENAVRGTPKVTVARKLIHAIDPSIQVVALQGRLPQSEVVDDLVTSDVALGCTDQQHSRLALSDLAYRYLIPTIDCGVVLEGEAGNVSGQVIQLVRMLAADACVLCRNMIDPQRVAQELMSSEERERRVNAATIARERGDDPNPYWQNERQINTVGYMTTAVGALVAGYVIGWITKTFDPPFERLQMNLVAPFLDVTDSPQQPRKECMCVRFRGWADQANTDALLSAPSHWPPVLVR